ncbi:hypothetical protein HYD66_01105 [Mycoplasmopsis bovis]|nr:hypothetical protein [Mycoplasmopsis bovis]QQH55031.1 hypothetical protein HYD66_01105 [Mycoplasmopsis bovis]
MLKIKNVSNTFLKIYERVSVYKYWKDIQFRYWYIESMSGRLPKNGNVPSGQKRLKLNDEIFRWIFNMI